MKKSLLALAVLGAFTGAASAQSSLTISGFINQAYGHQVNEKISYWADDGAGSRLAFSGMEDLGGGLKAKFVLEQRFSPNTGATAVAGSNVGTTALWSGQSYVALSSTTFGTVGVGRQYTPTFSLTQNTLDPFQGDGYAALRGILIVNDAAGTGVGNTTKAGIAAVRYENSLRYDYSGYGVNAAIAIADRQTNSNLTYNNTKGTGKPFSAAVNYTLGSLFLTAGLENPVGTGDYLATFGGAYNFGVALVSAGFSTGTQDAAGQNPHVSSFILGARVPFGKTTLKVGYGTSKIEWQNRVNKGSIGVDYNLSPRTKVFADYARYSGAAVSTAVSKNAYNLGIQHNF